MRRVVLCGLVGVGVMVGAAHAFECGRFTIDGGGASLSESGYALSGTIGQPDVGGDLVGGSVRLRGGFWGGSAGAVPCPGDADGDGFVNFTDLNLVLAGWGGSDPAGDVNGDGAVNFEDLNLVLGAWNAAC